MGWKFIYYFKKIRLKQSSGGYRNEAYFFSCSGIKVLFCSASEGNTENAWSVQIDKWYSDVDYNPDHKKYEGLYVRCLKD